MRAPAALIVLAFLLPVLLTQCGVPGRLRATANRLAAAAKKPKPKKEGEGANPGSLAALQQGGGTGAYPGAEMPGAPASTAAGAFDFSNVVQTQPQNFGRVGWHSSLTTAAQEARNTGKPLLILFTHQMSSSAQALENTLILTPDFRSLVEKSYIPLRLNYGDTDTRQSPFYRDFKTRLEAKGYPTVVITLPDGTEIKRLTGYNEKEGGEGSSYQKNYLKKLEDAVKAAESSAADRRKQMEPRGYRYWTTKDERKVFARLEALDANMATFITEWGDTFKTFLTRLSAEDQEEIQKRRPAQE